MSQAESDAMGNMHPILPYYMDHAPIESEEAPLAIAEISEAEAVEAANYTAYHYFSDARTFLDQLRTVALTTEDYRVGRVLSMIALVRNLLDAR